MTENNLPETLIKYYECNNLNCDALLNSYLWASYPLQFNDPFDCSEKFWDANSFTYEAIIGIIEDKKFKKRFSSKESNHQRRRLFMELFAPGVICLNEPCNEREDLLWGYYTNHEGFSIEFDCSALQKEFNTALFVKVEYTDLVKETKGCINNVPNEFVRWARLKKDIWKNEQEWRFVFSPDECNGYHPIFRMGDISVRQKKYALKAIRGITLGYRFFGEQIHKQRKLELSENTFAFDFLPEDNSATWHLLSTIYERGIELFQVELSEDFSLKKREIKILEISKSRIIVYYSNIVKS
jgi:hypothetical protein